MSMVVMMLVCYRCYDAEQQLEERERHPINHRDKHALHPVILGVLNCYYFLGDDFWFLVKPPL